MGKLAGKLLGSVSPAFGLASGKGLFGSSGFKDALGAMSPLAGMLGVGGGGGDDEDEEPNPGQKMFGMNADNTKASGNSFLSKFGSNLSDQLFQKAMMGFMGR